MNLKIAIMVFLLRKRKDVSSMIEYNYQGLICFFENLLINDFNCLENKNIEILNNELIKMIFMKIRKEEKLSKSELNIFLNTLYFDAIKFLGLDSKEIEMQFIYPDEMRLSSDCSGVHGYKNNRHYIYYNKSFLEEICKNTAIEVRVHFINTIIHELIHAKQIEDLNVQELNLNSYIISLEKIVKRNRKYYQKNYNYTKLETDARDRALEYLVNFFTKHKLLDKKLLSSLRELSSCYSNEMEDKFNNHKIDYMGNDIKNGCYLLLEAKDILSKNKRLFKKYPILIFSHYSNGDLKDYNKLLEEKEMFIKLLMDENVKDYEHVKLEIDSIYDYLFKCWNYGNTKLDTMYFSARGLRLSK